MNLGESEEESVWCVFLGENKIMQEIFRNLGI